MDITKTICVFIFLFGTWYILNEYDIDAHGIALGSF
jgi:hypothetical protein